MDRYAQLAIAILALSISGCDRVREILPHDAPEPELSAMVLGAEEEPNVGEEGHIPFKDRLQNNQHHGPSQNIGGKPVSVSQTLYAWRTIYNTNTLAMVYVPFFSNGRTMCPKGDMLESKTLERAKDLVVQYGITMTPEQQWEYDELVEN